MDYWIGVMENLTGEVVGLTIVPLVRVEVAPPAPPSRSGVPFPVDVDTLPVFELSLLLLAHFVSLVRQARDSWIRVSGIDRGCGSSMTEARWAVSEVIRGIDTERRTNVQREDVGLRAKALRRKPRGVCQPEGGYPRIVVCHKSLAKRNCQG